jgi:uroporphyrinogen decarboxylase
MTDEVQDYGIPLSIHICGNTTSIIPQMTATGARILEIDWQVDMGKAREQIPPETILMGNINPSHPAVFGTERDVEDAVRKIITSTKGRGVFVSTGCAMGRNTPPENFRAMIEATKKFGTREMILSLQPEH